MYKYAATIVIGAMAYTFPQSTLSAGLLLGSYVTSVVAPVLAGVNTGVIALFTGTLRAIL